MRTSIGVTGCVTGLMMLLAFGTAVPAGSQGQENADRQKLIGTWTGWIVDGRGDRPNAMIGKIAEMVITERTIRARDDQRDMGEGNYRLGRDQGWGTLDAAGVGAGPTRGKTYLGIYQIDGDTLRWCTANPGRPRPTQLMTRRGDGWYLMVLQRVRQRQ
jgi:uncharacterized protein (TIGR03067 family)